MKKLSFSMVAVAMIAAMSGPVSALADDGGNTAAVSGGVGRIDRLQTETALLQAELKVAQLKAAIAKANGTKHTAMPRAAAVSAQPLPTVVSLYGSPRNMEAVLGYPNGGTISVHAGSMLPDGGRVEQVSSGGVVITQHGARETLVFAAAPAAAPNIGTTIPSSPVPMLTPPPMVQQ